MSDGFTVNLDGLRDLEKALRAMGPEIGYKSARSGLMKASLPMLKAAKQNAQRIRDSGALAAAMGRWSRKGGSRGYGGARTVVTVQIGPRSKNKRAVALWNAHNNPKKPIRALGHAHLTEFGRNDGTGRQPYLRPAFQATAEVVVRNFGVETRKALERFGRKQIQRGRRVR